MVRNTKKRIAVKIRPYRSYSSNFIPAVFLSVFLFLTFFTFGQDLSTGIITQRNSSKCKFPPPDESFTILPDSSGYQNVSSRSTINCIAFKDKYTNTVKEFTQLKTTDKTLLIEIDTIITHKNFGIAIVQEEIAPENTAYENYISLYIITPYEENITLVFVGVYPSYLDKQLRMKFINASLGIKKT